MKVTRRNLPRVCLSAGLVFGLTYCESDPEGPAATLELGSGQAAFEPLDPGDHLMLSEGSQGGHHVWLSMRVEGLESGDLRMVLDVVPSAPARPAHTEVTLQFSEAEEAGWMEFVGWPAQVLDPACAVGKGLELQVKLVDAAGREVSESVTVVPEAPQHGFSVECPE